MSDNGPSPSNATSTNVMSEVTTLIKSWEDEHTQHHTYDPVPTLTRLAEIIEVETENYLKMDPDPFDERHPSRADPECKFGQILKALFRKDHFMNKLVSDYLRDTFYSRLGITGRDIDQLNIAACRLMLDVMPGLETSVVFQPDMDTLIHRLIKWTTNSIEPLQTYATGLLAAAMEIPDIATRFREQNGRLVPLLLQRLKRLQSSSEFMNRTLSSRPFAHLSSSKSFMKSPEQGIKSPPPVGNKRARDNGISPNCSPDVGKNTAFVSTPEGNESEGPKCKKLKTINETVDSHNKTSLFVETSNSSWAELESFMIGTVQIFPPTIATRQILILRYLTPVGEYQEFLSHVFEHNALDLILTYANVRETKEARLAFEAFKYLSSLLCHKKFSIEFINCNGLEALLEVPRPSIAATGVSMCVYYLAYSEEAMERVCLLPKGLVQNLVRYALWLLECSHDSGRCHAIMFFGLTFQFKIILDEFDAQDGLRKLHNVISTLPILLPDSDHQPLHEDQESAARQIVRHVCVAYRRYLEAHLYHKVEMMRQSHMKSNDRLLALTPVQPSYKACKSSSEEIQQQIETLLQSMPFKGHWAPVDHLLKLGCITLLLKIIAFAYEWNYSGRAETVRSALDVLAIACVMPKVQLLFCERVDLPEESVTVGMNIILGAAEGEIVADADVQKAALRVLVNCVCAPVNRVGGNTPNKLNVYTNSPNKKLKYKSSEELIQKVWDCVRANSGIMVLLQLMNIKTPITDADCIRTLACKALAGLARSETVRQIVSKLPLFTTGQLQNLMRDPILQEKRQEHVTFQKYALELLARLSGRVKTGNDLEVSLANIHRANIVAQTKIQFNDRQLLQLIHQHLVSKGYVDTAAKLLSEANLSHAITSVGQQHPLKFRYSSTLNSSRTRLSFSSPNPRPLPSPTDNPEISQTVVNGLTPTTSTIKLIKKNQSQPSTPVQNSRLQKQITSDFHLRATPQNTTDDPSTSSEPPRVSLDSIITEYLANQHALCKNPMATCPQFNLFVPHKCPDPKPRITAAYNCGIRMSRRAMGYQSRNMDRRFIHSRVCPVQTIRTNNDQDVFITCAKFMPGDQQIIAGISDGNLILFNLPSGSEEISFHGLDNYIVSLEPNRTGEFVLASATWGSPLSAMISTKSYQIETSFTDEYIEYGKVSQNRIIGTRNECATLYDASTGTSVMSLVPTVSNQYTKNKATFSIYDDLVLSDGVLFDVASGKQIHKLDKLNQTQSGVFHPNGLEIVSNTEVWDIRTFRLLKTVPVLNQCNVVFSKWTNTIYANVMEQEMDDGDSTYDSSFKTVDAIDYSSIATIDVKRNIYDLAVNSYDTQIAIVENQGVYQSGQESYVKLYDVGRKRDDEDEQDEEDDDEDMGGSDDDPSDNDDVIIMRGDNENNDDNGNNDQDILDDDNQEDEDDDDDDNSSDGDSDWSTMSDGSGSSYDVPLDLLFEM